MTISKWCAHGALAARPAPWPRTHTDAVDLAL